MFDKRYLSGDIYGGITAAIVALPLALAFGVQSGLGAIAGLYGAIALGILAAMFGGTKTQISGPTGPMAVVAAAIVAGQIAHYGSVEAAFGTIIATFVLAGAFQLILGFSRIGRYIRYMPYPVVSGFMTGIGVIIIIMQIFPFFGMASPVGIVQTLASLPEIPAGINWQAVMLALATVAVIYLLPRLTKAVPSTLVALIVLTLLSTFAGLNVPVIGDIPTGLPEVHADTIFALDWQHPMLIIIPALTLAALGAIDSLLTSVVADNLTKTQHDSDRELIGQGLGNMAAGFIGGLPGAGATMRTVVNINAGGRTQLSGVIHGIVLLVILLGAGAYASLIPLPVLAGILITVGIGIIDYKSFRHLSLIPRADAFIMVTVLLLTVLVDLLQAVAVGLVMAALWFMKQMGDTAEAAARGDSLANCEESYTLPDERDIDETFKQRVYLQHFDGPIFFGFTSQFKRIIGNMPEVDTVIFRMKNVPHIDQSGMYAIEDAVLELKQRNINVVFTALQTQPENMLRRINLIPGLVPEDAVFPDFPSAVASLKPRVS